MAKLIYTAIASLDGYIADEDGKFDWAEPDEEVHAFVNDLERRIGTYLYGRRLYEVMVAWETIPPGDQPAFVQDYAEIWRAPDKIVYSRTLEAPASARTRIERDFNPEAVRELKTAADRDLSEAALSSRPRRSRPVWSTSAICSLRPSSSEAANGPFLRGCAYPSSSWTNALSATARSISITEPAPSPRPGEVTNSQRLSSTRHRAAEAAPRERGGSYGETALLARPGRRLRADRSRRAVCIGRTGHGRTEHQGFGCEPVRNVHCRRRPDRQHEFPQQRGRAVDRSERGRPKR
jgi:dihydrofolate reductase